MTNELVGGQDNQLTGVGSITQRKNTQHRQHQRVRGFERDRQTVCWLVLLSRLCRVVIVQYQT